jgi:sucrose phosphorylase
MQFKVSEMGYWVYDFALPVLTLHALYSGDGQYLRRWMEMRPRHQFTTLDTHDGLGQLRRGRHLHHPPHRG